MASLTPRSLSNLERDAVRLWFGLDGLAPVKDVPVIAREVGAPPYLVHCRLISAIAKLRALPRVWGRIAR